MKDVSSPLDRPVDQRGTGEDIIIGWRLLVLRAVVQLPLNQSKYGAIPPETVASWEDTRREAAETDDDEKHEPARNS